ncbi:hypothetical protein MuYL_3989 [Mucilaginibacter xinganensis]|uniref:Uncharacterized protein n=1 Tax=Mucilaginibacter xinganensis TaxID=1234841 RepID=A0A223P1Q8_9SPHI|nr:hypothetical protein MuYL_3989 [Mucilaginibacter xinganensis]
MGIMRILGILFLVMGKIIPILFENKIVPLLIVELICNVKVTNKFIYAAI